MRKKTEGAILDWQAEAARLRKEREGEPGAFTTQEFAESANMGVGPAYQYLLRESKKGRYRKSKKVVGGRMVAAWVMEKKA